jgi:CRP-like cAMP-binding protein
MSSIHSLQVESSDAASYAKLFGKDEPRYMGHSPVRGRGDGDDDDDDADPLLSSKFCPPPRNLAHTNPALASLTAAYPSSGPLAVPPLHLPRETRDFIHARLASFTRPAQPAHSPAAFTLEQMQAVFALPAAQRPAQLQALSAALHALPFFSALPLALLAIILAHARPLFIAAGMLACPVAPPHGDLYVLAAGHLALESAVAYRHQLNPGACIGSLQADEDDDDDSRRDPAPQSSSSSSPPVYYHASADALLLHLSPAAYRSVLHEGLAAHLADTLRVFSRLPVISTLPPAKLLELARVAAPTSLPPHSLVIAQGRERLEAGMYVLTQGAVVIARRMVRVVCGCGTVPVQSVQLCAQDTAFESSVPSIRNAALNNTNHAYKCRQLSQCPKQKKVAYVVETGRLDAPALIGEVSVLTGSPREAHVYTSCDSVVLRIARPDLYQLIPSDKRQALVALALETSKYSSEALVEQALRQQRSWAGLKTRLVGALVQNQQQALHR